jgi:hypothetical protein
VNRRSTQVALALASAAAGAVIATAGLSRKTEQAATPSPDSISTDESPDAEEVSSEVRESTATAEDPFSLTGAAKENAAALIALLSTFFIAMRIFSAAGYSLTTAYGILQAGGAGTVVIGAALSLIGLIPPWIVSLSVTWLHDASAHTNHVKRNMVIGLIVCFTIIAIFSSPVAALAMIAAIFLLELYLHFPTRSRKEAMRLNAQISPAEWEEYFKERGLKFKKPSRLPVGMAVILAISLFTILGNTTPWLPSEEVTLTNAKPVTGYVLSLSDQFTAVLLPTGHGISYIATSDIKARKVCTIGFTGLIWRSLPELTTSRPYQPCPSETQNKSTPSKSEKPVPK